MKLYDITDMLRADTPAWPGDAPVELVQDVAIARGDPVNLGWYRFSSHAGTHVDPPYHFIEGGRRLHELRLEELIGPCWVVDLAFAPGHLTAHDLDTAGIPPGTTRLLLKTRNSLRQAAESPRFDPDYVALAPDGARWIVEHGVRLAGIDCLSVDPFEACRSATTGRDYPAHWILLGADIPCIESLMLRDVPEGAYELICLPLRVQDGNGCPVRAVLRG